MSFRVFDQDIGDYIPTKDLLIDDKGRVFYTYVIDCSKHLKEMKNCVVEYIHDD